MFQFLIGTGESFITGTYFIMIFTKTVAVVTGIRAVRDTSG
jgi:hypothetical protein